MDLKKENLVEKIDDRNDDPLIIGFSILSKEELERRRVQVYPYEL